MVTAVALWGANHTDHDRLAVTSIGRVAALALDRGRHPKRYTYTDANEDVAAAVLRGDRLVLAVADGHTGRESSEVAVGEVLRWAGHDLPDEIDDDLLIDLFHAAGRVVHGVTSDPACPHPESRTTLVVAVLGAGRLDWASIGDSAIFLGGPTRVARLDRPRNRFLGGPMSRRDVARTVDRGHLPLASDDVVVLASDGVVDFVGDPTAAVARALGASRLAGVARALARAAFDGGAGDNVAIAAGRLPGAAGGAVDP